jgi:ABC-type nickel/cobalt efflux system permease component RcnA
MKGKRTYSKAILLLIVFSMNTVVSFACSFSTLFHQSHHNNTNVQSDHHHNEPAQEDEHAEHQHDPKTTDKKDVHDCCSESVLAIEQMEKSVSKTIEAPDVLFLTVLLASYSSAFPLSTTLKVVLPCHDRWRVPTTIQDLRIVIQSFQI